MSILPRSQAKGRKPGLQWNYQGPPATSRMLDFVPGRDAVYPPQTLKRGTPPSQIISLSGVCPLGFQTLEAILEPQGHF